MQETLYTVAVVLFTINMLAGVVIKNIADGHETPQAIDKAFRAIIRSDLFITIPALLAILVTNITVNEGKYVGLAPVPMLVFAAIAYSFIFFLFIIHPLRARLHRFAKDAGSVQTFDRAAYNAVSQKWVVLGTIELAPTIGLLLYSIAS